MKEKKENLYFKRIIIIYSFKRIAFFLIIECLEKFYL